MIDVCCAIIVHEGKMLAVQKGPKSSHPWKWEFPGGKINAGESPEQCIVREIKEELMVGVKIQGRLEAIEFDYGTKSLCLIPFFCNLLSGEITLTEHISMRWLNWNEWENLDWAEADRQLIIKNELSLKELLS